VAGDGFPESVVLVAECCEPLVEGETLLSLLVDLCAEDVDSLLPVLDLLLGVLEPQLHPIQLLDQLLYAVIQPLIFLQSGRSFPLILRHPLPHFRHSHLIIRVLPLQ
jgi:hypothetical protein